MIYLFITLLSINTHASVSLKQAYHSARLNMETLKRADFELQRAKERKKQAVGTLLPTVSAVGHETRIDRPKQSGVNRAFILTRQYSAGLRLEQPLLRGGSLSGLQSRNEEVLLSEFQKDATELSLYRLVINAYYNLYYANLDLKNLEDLLKFSREREREIQSLTKVGRSRKGELVQAQTQLLTAESQYRLGQMALAEAKHNFEFFTAIKPNDQVTLSTLPKQLPSLMEYIEKLKDRPDIKARRQEVQVAQKSVDIAKGGHLPNVDLIGNYYVDRTGVLQTSEWDLAVVVRVPLYQGGTVSSQVRESLDSKRISELNADETYRSAKRELVIQYENYHRMQDQLATMQEALKKSEQAYRLNLQDYRFGQVTNLEVLQSLNLFIETRRSYNNLIAQTQMTYKGLEASIGVLP